MYNLAGFKLCFLKLRWKFNLRRIKQKQITKQANKRKLNYCVALS